MEIKVRIVLQGVKDEDSLYDLIRDQDGEAFFTKLKQWRGIKALDITRSLADGGSAGGWNGL